MRFANFRTLLLKRASDDALQRLIKLMPDELFELAITESLEKMSSDAKGRAINPALAMTLGHALPHEGTKEAPLHGLENMDAALIHENLNHHLSHYNAALKTGHRQKADSHLAQVMRTINYAERLGGAAKNRGIQNGVRIRNGSTAPHSHDEQGNLVKVHHEGGSLISPTPWEMNYAGSGRNADGSAQECPKGWNREVTGKSETTFPDFRYAEMKPHQHASTDSYPIPEEFQQSAYPFHDLQVNGHYVQIDPQQASDGKFASHILDSHPAMRHAYTQSDGLSPAKLKEFSEDHKQWLNSPELTSWLDKQAGKAPDAWAHDKPRSAPIHGEAQPSPYDAHYGRRLKRQAKDKSAGIQPISPKHIAQAQQGAAAQPAADQPPPTAVDQPQSAPISPATPAEQPASPAKAPPKVDSSIIHILGKRLSPEKISELTEMPIDQIKMILGNK